jgi:hypothetical protein
VYAVREVLYVQRCLKARRGALPRVSRLLYLQSPPSFLTSSLWQMYMHAFVIVIPKFEFSLCVVFSMRVMLTRAFPKILETIRRSSQSSSRKGSTYKIERLEDGPKLGGGL